MYEIIDGVILFFLVQIKLFRFKSHSSISDSSHPTDCFPSILLLGNVGSKRGDFGFSQSYIVARAMPVL